MVQEIISYIIIGSAVGLVALKSAKCFFIPEKRKKKGSKCASCTAECILKDILPANRDHCPSPKN